MKAKKYFKKYFPLIVLAIMAVVSLRRAGSLYPLPYPHFDKLITEKDELRDVAGIVSGFRGAVADIAWLELLQYCGGDTLPDEGKPDSLEQLKYMTLRVVRIDPYFYDAYLFSAGILAWYQEVNRPDEAIEILEEGIRNNPRYWLFRIYLGAIVYKKSAEYGKMASLLEEAMRYPDCPSLIKSILANYYKEQRQYRKAITVWESLRESGDPMYVDRAIEQIRLLKKKL